MTGSTSNTIQLDMIKGIKKRQNSVPPLDNQILGICGSPRKNGNSDILLKRLLSGAGGKTVDCAMLHLREVQFQGCIGCEKCRRDKICTGLTDGMTVLYDRILSSRGLVLACPTHNYNITSWMKAFIDRLYCFYNFQNTRPRAWSSQLANQGRKAVLIAVCEQEDPTDMGFTLEAMRLPIQALGYDIIGEQAVFGIFDKGGVKTDSSVLDNASQLGRKLAAAIREEDG